jgi:hypothetical protein
MDGISGLADKEISKKGWNAPKAGYGLIERF